jgi:hypothetical protein
MEVTLRLTVDITSCRDVTVWNLRKSKLLYDWRYILLPVAMLLSEVSEGRSYFTTDGRYYFLSRCYCLKFAKMEVTLRLTVDITSCRDVTVWNLRTSKLLYQLQSVSQYVLVSSTLVALATRYYFLSGCYCLKFDALSVASPLFLCRHSHVFPRGVTCFPFITHWQPGPRCVYIPASTLKSLLLSQGLPESDELTMPLRPTSFSTYRYSSLRVIYRNARLLAPMSAQLVLSESFGSCLSKGPNWGFPSLPPWWTLKDYVV